MDTLRKKKTTLSKTVASYARLFANNPDNEKIGQLLADATNKFESVTKELQRKSLAKYETVVLVCGTVLSPSEQAVLESITRAPDFRNVESSVNANQFICSSDLGMALVQATLPSLVKKRMIYGYSTKSTGTIDLTEKGQEFVLDHILR